MYEDIQCSSDRAWTRAHRSFLGDLVSPAWAWWPSFGSPPNVDTTQSRLLSCTSIPTPFAPSSAHCGSPITCRLISSFSSDCGPPPAQQSSQILCHPVGYHPTFSNQVWPSDLRRGPFLQVCPFLSTFPQP